LTGNYSNGALIALIFRQLGTSTKQEDRGTSGIAVEKTNVNSTVLIPSTNDTMVVPWYRPTLSEISYA